MLQAHEANTSRNVNHVYDKDNIHMHIYYREWSQYGKMKDIYYDIDVVYYVNLLIQTGG